MIQADQFDIKTGKPIQVAIEGQWQPAIKQVEHSYLEHWCQVNNVDTGRRFSVAQFYESVHDSDRQQLESENKHLVFSSGSEGYFTDFETAQLMTLGSETVTPIYAEDRDSPHNSVAYGGLIASDGVASTVLPSALVLVIDNENRTHGADSLYDWEGQPVSTEDLQDLYDKMGDGTMLVRASTIDSLITPEERNQITVSAFERAGISTEFSSLGEDLDRVDKVGAATTAKIEQSLRHQSDTGVYQFRAASPDLPGIAKGTVTYSSWVERLEVDAIISADNIKGDDGRLSAPGIKAVSNFWVNRKATAAYGQQTVGPQVKYTIPEATRLEINPRVQKKAEALAQVAGDYAALSYRYLKHKESERDRPYESAEEEASSNSRPDWLYNALDSDKYGQLTDQAGVIRGLESYIKGQWQRLSANGTSVPSAMAQHHSKLKPWEVCNKDLPHGAIVAYYRSPFPNVGAAAIAINNTKIIQQQDREAFSKQGVAYLPPSTAKNVAITDFDGDINGFFVGYEPTIDNLPEQLREDLASAASLPKDQHYEVGRAAIEGMIHRLEEGQDSSIKPSVDPIAVKEFVTRTAPEVAPPQIVKQQKGKHSWQEGESHSEATWRAWGITADNPTGKVANAGMALQALALELKYAPDESKEVLLRQVTDTFSRVLKKADLPAEANDKIFIPSDEWLDSQGFSVSYGERMKDIVIVGHSLEKIKNDQQRQEFVKQPLIQEALDEASALLSEIANGPNAVNLQTAVDTAKSAKGIDEDLHNFVEALQYKKDDFRFNKNNPSIYVNGQEMPTSVDEPVSWGVQSVNEQYGGAVLQERKHEAFQAVFPKDVTDQQRQEAKSIISTSSGLIAQVMETKARHRQQRPEDQKPTVEVTLSDGRQLNLQNIADEQGKLPVWRVYGQQPDWTIRIKQDAKATEQKQFPAQLVFVDSEGVRQAERIGYVSPASAEQHQLSQKFQQHNQKLTISAPTVTTQVPWARQNDSKMLYAQRDQYLERSLAPPAGKDPQIHSQEMATALWRQSKGGRKLVMQEYPEVLRDRLQTVPEMTLNRLQVSSEVKQALVERSPLIIQFSQDTFQVKGVETVLPSVSVLKSDGDHLLLGTPNTESLALPAGATYMAAFSHNPTSEKVVDMQMMDLPTVAQTPAELAAIKVGDRTHLTFDGEPHADYGVREGQLVIVQAAEGGEQMAVRVGAQHRIDTQLLQQAGAVQRWAEAEKQPSSALFEKLAAARTDGKELWGLNVEALGTYERGQIKTMVVEQPVTTPESVALPSIEQPSVEKSELSQAPESASAPSGVMAAIARTNPALKQRLEQYATENSSEKTEQGVIAQGSESNARSQAERKGKSVDNWTAKVTPSNQKSAQRRRRSQSKYNGIGD
ncbi:MAG: hypothetical protein DCF25_10125 [Leptolyngbya foveolarum]|uniref:Uncharacterized protein n=1 Tax=Leptolyngbya foveolarum TaxID=47253 RepID=A0A2W4UFX0_9CYAN|nr:MAG: hypothetical protein DCF25_10125 [Leptolyngbya foveolarum]